MQLWSVHTVTVLLKENVDKVLISGFYIVETFQINTFIVNFGPVSETYAKLYISSVKQTRLPLINKELSNLYQNEQHR